ncbi:MAG: asparagine synthase (glutamine-hydrolyzing) [Desulfobulbaceae bacterium]|jgi:asparagine synthase (glutamine-hydrolysing)|nr:asparagine synthase (glutamine-hydrolyzing) [Desulfobulbaceae bacterium]
MAALSIRPNRGRIGKKICYDGGEIRWPIEENLSGSASMCGIAGIFSYRPTGGQVDAAELSRITSAQARRGPDAEGFWFSGDRRIGFGHRRLSIIDLSEAANQPLTSHDGRYVIVFNGEIYNYRALRQELEAAGSSFITHGDTEVILEAWRHWGAAALGRLRGMFAFALFDCLDKKLLLARDPYGIKPLYYSDDGHVLRFASSVKALHLGNLPTNDLDPVGLTGFLLMGSVPEPYTIHKAARSLGAGQFLAVENGIGGEQRQYASIAEIWRLGAAGGTTVSTDEAMEHIAVAVRDAVASHLVADVPVGAFLSAGIDSGALVGLVSGLVATPMTTITLGFSDFRGAATDETALAEEIAKRYRTRHQTHWVSDADIQRSIPDIFAAMDQPSLDGLNSWLVSKAAHEAGLKVVLSGVGGDELLGGYGHFQSLPVLGKRLAAVHAVPFLARAATGFARILSGWGIVPPKAPALAAFGDDMAALYFAQRGLFMPWEIADLIGCDMAREGLAHLPVPAFLAGNLSSNVDDFTRIAALESTNYLRNQLLRDSDWASMDHSLELRTPLVDATLLRSLSPILSHCPPGWRRKLGLAAAPSPPLPESVLRRPKSGFALPMARWMAEVADLDSWRQFPALRHPACHWSRRMAGTLLARFAPELIQP